MNEKKKMAIWRLQGYRYDKTNDRKRDWVKKEVKWRESAMQEWDLYRYYTSGSNGNEKGFSHFKTEVFYTIVKLSQPLFLRGS